MKTLLVTKSAKRAEFLKSKGLVFDQVTFARYDDRIRGKTFDRIIMDEMADVSSSLKTELSPLIAKCGENGVFSKLYEKEDNWTVLNTSIGEIPNV